MPKSKSASNMGRREYYIVKSEKEQLKSKKHCSRQSLVAIRPEDMVVVVVDGISDEDRCQRLNMYVCKRKKKYSYL